MKAGYEEAILLDDHGNVCEGSGENIFIVWDGRLVTPPPAASILDGITRKSVIQIARDLGYEVIERNIARAELYMADEVFMTGTAAELVPVREVDDHAIGAGEPGEITRAIQATFEDALHGRTDTLPGVARPGTGARQGRMSQLGPRSVGEFRRRPDARASGRPATNSPSELLKGSTPHMTQIELYDATLRDGMGGGGLSLTAEEKVRLVHRLDDLGVRSSRPASPHRTRRRPSSSRCSSTRRSPTRRSRPSG